MTGTFWARPVFLSLNTSRHDSEMFVFFRAPDVIVTKTHFAVVSKHRGRAHLMLNIYGGQKKSVLPVQGKDS